MGSVTNFIPERGTLAYGTSKAAFMHATKIMANEFYIYLSILTPLIAFFITPLLSSNPNLRDSLGPIGGIITFYSSLNIASLYINGEILSYTFFQKKTKTMFRENGVGGNFGFGGRARKITPLVYPLTFQNFFGHENSRHESCGTFDRCI